MNLIEKLGGYEKALVLLKGCPLDSGIVDVPNPKSKGMIRFDLGDLRAALADHDRTDYVSDIRNHISPTTVVIEK